MKLLADLLGSIALTLTLFFFYEHFLQKKEMSPWTFPFLYGFDCLLNFTAATFAPFPLQRICCFAVFLILPLFLYKDNFPLKFALTIIFCATISLAEVLVKAILLDYNGSSEAFSQIYAYNYLLGAMLSKTAAFLLIYCYTLFGKAREAKLPFYLYCLLLFVPTISLVLYYFIQNMVYTANHPSVYRANCYVTLMLLLLNVINIFLFFQASEASWLQARAAYEKQLFDRQKQYHKNLASYHQKIRQLYHDLHHHFLILYQALAENDTATAMQHLQTQLDYLTTSQTTYTGYLLLDTILDYKSQTALQQQTAYMVQSQLEPALSLEETVLPDLDVILASCLDNALEATAKIADPQQRWIKIKLHNDATYIYLHLENAVHQQIAVRSAKLPPTTKANPLLHGLGLHTVEKLVQKHDGKLLLECDDHKFTAGLMVKYS